MRIGGVEKLTLIDYPGKLAAIVFTVGCNFRCGFCYNPMLVRPRIEELDTENIKGQRQSSDANDDSLLTSVAGLFNFLKKRAGKLEGVVITGGEPTLHPDLPEFIQQIKSLGYSVKLDTNGTNPKMLKRLINKGLIDYIAMDLKAPAKKYSRTTNVSFDFNKIEESVKMIMSSGLPYEFRTTVVPSLIKEADIAAMGKLIKGAAKWYLQRFKADTELLDPSFKHQPSYTVKEMKALASLGRQFVDLCESRG